MSPEDTIRILKSLGWIIKDVPGGHAPQYLLPPWHQPGQQGIPYWAPRLPEQVPNFYADINAAMQVVEKAKEMGYDLLLDNVCQIWSARFSAYSRTNDKLDEFEGERETSPSAAICEAFLKLLDHTTETE